MFPANCLTGGGVSQHIWGPSAFHSSWLLTAHYPLNPTGLLYPQIPATAFSLVTKDGQPVCYDMEVPDSGIDLQCTLAPDGSFAWTWRVKHGQLENRP